MGRKFKAANKRTYFSNRRKETKETTFHSNKSIFCVGGSLLIVITYSNFFTPVNNHGQEANHNLEIYLSNFINHKHPTHLFENSYYLMQNLISNTKTVVTSKFHPVL